MAQTTECMLLASEFKKAENFMKSAAAAPIRMMNTLTGMIMNAQLSMLKTTNTMFNELAGKLGLTAIEDLAGELADGLLHMQQCAGSISSNPLIKAAIGTDLASMKFGNIASAVDIAGHTRKYAQNLAKKNALAALDKGMREFGLGGSSANTQMRYQQMLKSTGITDAANAMGSIAGCLAGICPAVGDFQASIDRGLGSLNLNPDQTVGDLWSTVDAAKKAAINDTAARGRELEARVNSWAGGIF